MNNIYFPKLASACFLTCLCLQSFTACKPKGIQPGDETQSAAAKTSMTAGLAEIERSKAQVYSLLGGFRDTVATQLLIPTTEQFPPTPIAESQVMPHYGTFTETSAGQFNFTPSNTDTITVEYLNGVDLVLGSMTFNDSRNLATIRMTFSFDNRGIDTPRVNEISGFLSEGRADNKDDIARLNSFDYRLASNFGLSFFDQSGAPVKLGFDFYHSVATNPAPPGPKAFVRKENRVWNPLFPKVNNWSSKSYTEYARSQVSGAYAAVNMTRTYQHVTSTDRIDYAAQVDLNYGGIQIIALEGFTVYDAGVGEVLYTADDKTVRVAKLEGTGHQCDVTAPNAAGTGGTITMNWFNNTKENIMPGFFTCPSAILAP